MTSIPSKQASLLLSSLQMVHHRETDGMRVGRTNQVRRVIFTLLIANSSEQAWAMLLDHKNKKWKLQMHECSRCALASTAIARDCRHKDIVAFRSCKYMWKQAGICDKKNPYIGQFNSDFRIQKSFFFLWIKSMFCWSQQPAPFDFDKAKTSLNVFCCLIICRCAGLFQAYGSFHC